MRQQIKGRVFPGLKVVEVTGKDRTRHTMVIVQCRHCGKVNPKPMRWSDVKRDPKGSRPANKSCGCLEEAAFWTYVDRKFNEIPHSERFAIFTEAQVTTSTSAVAKRHGLDKYTCAQVITRTRTLIKESEGFALERGLNFMSIRMRYNGGGYWKSRFRPKELTVKDGQLVGSWSLKYVAAVTLLDRFKDLDRSSRKTEQAFVTTGIQLLESLRAAQWIVDTWQNTIVIRHELKKKYARKAERVKVAEAAVVAKPTRVNELPIPIDYEGFAAFVRELNHRPAAVSAGAA